MQADLFQNFQLVKRAVALRIGDEILKINKQPLLRASGQRREGAANFFCGIECLVDAFQLFRCGDHLFFLLVARLSPNHALNGLARVHFAVTRLSE